MASMNITTNVVAISLSNELCGPKQNAGSLELHSYSWYSGNLDGACGKYVKDVMRAGGFLLDQGWPLFISEFGADGWGTNANDNNFLNCFFGLAAERDLEWAPWAFQGSYYLRRKVGTDEVYGLLDSSWGQLRNASFLQRLSTIQPPSQDVLLIKS
ncbi:Cellulase protein [Cinnamomum micranthum f. kanehirae]|uniref:Cellulase protein n=1 Tax=Cinnamomum micranthum f. kanehirae TaxID=337451 RepID=A0A3S3NR03_9MAGN|nr:Cellulase protein [Cinnamomum micranthum f. kanehirae]